MSTKKSSMAVLLGISLMLALSGCSLSFSGSGSSEASNGGVYKSINKGDMWAWKILVPSTKGQPDNIGAVDIESMAIDPSDTGAIYLGTSENGLLYSYNGGESWEVTSRLNHGKVSAVAVDPANKCNIYAAIGNKIYKSSDCGRFWNAAYYDNDIQLYIYSIAIDINNSSSIFISTSRGEVIKSSDAGNTWRTIGRFDDKVKKVEIRSQNSRVIFASTQKSGLFRSDDGGTTWKDLRESLKEFNDGTETRDVVASPSDSSIVYLASKYGLLKSINNGDNWRKINLITPEAGATINTVAINPTNANEIYYVTNTTFYHSTDGGQNWATKKIPTSRAGWRLLIDPKNTNIIYMGVKVIK